jgi:23S rRNA pseudouridine1911/1915/1917 synthase
MKLQAEPEDRGSRLDVFLARRLNTLTRSQIQTLNKAGAILIEGRQEKAGYKMRGGEAIDVDLKPLAPPTLQPEHIPLQIYYEDEDLAVIEKPAGLVVHPGAGTTNQTVVHGLLFHFQSLSGAGGDARPGIVHRIDKWTSGLLVIAKNDQAHTRLSRAFQERHVEKTYIALVHGKLPRSTGEVALNIGRHSSVRTRMAAVRQRGRTAFTSYRVLEEFRGFSLLEVKIKTGRTHQFRVHLSAIGHPVVGDNVYGESRYPEFVKKYGAPGRYFLHAGELKFTHPSTGVPLEFRSPLPRDLQSLLERIKV